MTPTAQAPRPSQPQVNDVTGPLPAPNLVQNIPVHNPGQPSVKLNEDDELDKIIQDVGKEMIIEDIPDQRRHFLGFSRHHKTPAPIPAKQPQQNTPKPAPANPQPVAKSAPQAQPPQNHTRVKPAAQKPAKPPKQHHIPVAITAMTVLVTAALIAVAYHAYK